MLSLQMMLLPSAPLVLSHNYREPNAYLNKVLTGTACHLFIPYCSQDIQRNLRFKTKKRPLRIGVAAQLVQFYWIGVERNHTVMLL